MNKPSVLFLFVACIVGCNASMNKENFKPSIDIFETLYASGEYDSIITILRMNKANSDTTSDSRVRLVTMLELFKEELGEIKTGNIGEIEKFFDTQKGSGYQVIYYTEFENGSGFIKFIFKETNNQLLIDEFHFGSNLLGPEFVKKIQDRISSKNSNSKTSE